MFIKSVFRFGLFMLLAMLSSDIAFSEVNDNNIALIEEKTNEKGWRFDGKCEGRNADFKYQLSYYAPPKFRDLGGYGILKVKRNGIESIYTGYEFDPSASKNKNECGLLLGKNILLFDSEDWSSSMRYLVSVNLRTAVKSIFQYNLKHTIAFKKKISDDVYLIAGFGVCERNKGIKGGMIKLFCEEISHDRYSLARNNLFQSTGMKYLSPYIPGVGSGVFSYHVICDECNNVSSKLIEQALREYFTSVVLKKIKQLKSIGDKKSFYSALLALESIAVHVPSLEKEFSSALFLQDVTDKQVIISSLKDYWNIIFENHLVIKQDK